MKKNHEKNGEQKIHRELYSDKLKDDTKKIVQETFEKLGLKEGVDYTETPDEYRIEIKNEKGEWKKTIRITKLEFIPVDENETPIEKVIEMIVTKEKMLG